MKDLSHIEKFLLPTAYRMYGMWLIVAGIPAVLVVFSVIILSFKEGTDQSYWDIWGGYFIHIPISVGLFWTLFAAEKQEDEMYTALRLKATLHGIRFIFIAILFLPVFSIVSALWRETAVTPPNLGGNLAIVSLLLLYANVTYWHLKRKALSDEE